MAAKSKASKRSPASVPALPDTIHKEYIADEIKSVDEDARTIRFRISTDTIDREKDIVDPKGWQTEDYMRNPVVLFGHDYRSLPVARALSLASDEHGLSMVAQFPPAEVYPFADTVYQMVKAGFLNATSVGFKPVKWNADSETGGTRYHEQSLLEVSLVPVPANPQALVEARALGIDPDPLRAWATKILELDTAAPGDPVLKSGAPAPDMTPPGEAPEPASTEPPALPPPAIGKAGRVLSGRNESALRDSLAALNAAMQQLNGVLAQVQAGQGEDEEPPATPEADEDEDEKAPSPEAALQPILTITDAAETQVEKDLIVLRLVDDPEPRFTVDPVMVSAAIARGYITSLAPVVDARVGAAISALRGRID